jgi:16S rRNA C967 or C1407 C5-methylase (RsmB/RsmF family)/NOL1/NOP2/fmu family ribosome biogenesis protein
LNTSSTPIPDDFISNLKVNYAQADELIDALNSEPATSIRINSSKINFNLTEEPVSWCPTGYYLTKRPLFTLDPLLHAGGYYVQEASSMFLAQITQLIDTKLPLTILDLCAAPGGKTTHLLDLFPNALVVSNEIIRNRSKILAENCTKWGNCNSVITNSEPQQLGRLSGMFDIILIDAPCSGEGMFRKDDTARKEWSLTNVDNCYLRQREIVDDIIPALKEDGLLIYSTCTFNEKENDKNVSYFTSAFDLHPQYLPLLPDTNIEKTEYGYQFYPHKTKGEGFFMSFLQKQASSTHYRTKNSRSTTLTPRKSNLLATHIQTTTKLIDNSQYLTYQDMLHLFPIQFYDKLLALQEQTRIVQFGTKAGKLIKDKFQPEHDLALCHQVRLTGFECLDLSYDEAISYLRKQPFAVPAKKEGWCIVRYQSLALGWIKIIQNRFNNYYPTDWRIYNTQLTGNFSIQS